MAAPRGPLVYSCSGCSSAAQTANHLALRLDREGVAEMSCIAGVGGGVPALVKTARSGRRILALDGCAMACVAACLDQAGVRADTHLVLGELGVRKQAHADHDPMTVSRLLDDIVRPAARALAASPAPFTPPHGQ